MATAAIRNFDEKNIRRKDLEAYRIFGWVKSKKKPENVKGGKRAPDLVIRRKLEYSCNTALTDCEKKYFKLYKKKYRQKPIRGILSFVLMIAFLAVAVLELIIGISAILPEKTETPAETPEEEVVAEIQMADDTSTENTDEEGTDKTESTEAPAGILDIVYNINGTYLAPIIDPLLKDTVVYLPDDSYITIDVDTEAEYVLKDTVIKITEEATEEGADPVEKEITVASDSKVFTDGEGKKYIYLEGTARLISIPALAESLGLGGMLNTEIVVGAVALVLFIIALIIFVEIAKIKKKRKIKAAKLSELEYQAQNIIGYMGSKDPTLLPKHKRTEMIWTNIIANGIRQANYQATPTYTDDDDDE